MADPNQWPPRTSLDEASPPGSEGPVAGRVNRSTTGLGSALPASYAHGAGLLLCLGLTAAAWLGGIGPILQARSEALSQRQRLSREQDQLRDYETRTIQVERRLDDIRLTLAESPMHLAPVSAINRELASISGFTAEADLIVEELNAGEAQDWPRFKIVPIQLRGDGRFAELASLLHRLHQQTPDLGLAGIELNVSPGAANAKARFELTLAWYAAPN